MQERSTGLGPEEVNTNMTDLRNDGMEYFKVSATVKKFCLLYVLWDVLVRDEMSPCGP